MPPILVGACYGSTTVQTTGQPGPNPAQYQLQEPQLKKASPCPPGWEDTPTNYEPASLSLLELGDSQKNKTSPEKGRPPPAPLFGDDDDDDLDWLG